MEGLSGGNACYTPLRCKTEQYQKQHKNNAECGAHNAKLQLWHSAFSFYILYFKVLSLL